MIHKTWVSFFLFFLGLGGNKIIAEQIWLDTEGRKIEATFVRLDDENLILQKSDQTLVIPLSILSQSSLALARKLGVKEKQIRVTPPSLWTDVEGRVIKANFVHADAFTVTLEMNGQNFTLPMEMLDKKSMHEAFIWSQNQPEGSKKLSPKGVVDKTEKKEAVPTGKKTEDLSQSQTWTSTDGRTTEAHFVNYKNKEITLRMKSGREIKMPDSKLSSESQQLAKTLKGLKDKKDQKLAQTIALRKKMKVPKLVDQDLTKMHSLQNVQGQTVKAQFIGANDHEVIIGLTNNPSRPIAMKWDRFNTKSQALLEGLRRLKKSMITPAGKNRLASFSRGPFKGYNSVLTSEHYDVALSANGKSVMIWLKSTEAKQKPKAFTVNFQNTYNYRALKRDNKGKIERHANGKPVYRWPSRSRSIKKLDDFFEPSMSRENITLRGSLDNGAKFEYNVELNKKGLRFWSKLEEKKPAAPKTELDIAFTPTKLYFSVGVPGLISDAKNATNQKVKEIVGDASVSLRPQSGTLRQFPYKEQWTITKKKFQGEKFSTLQSMIFAGFPYGKNKLTVINQSTSDMNIGYHYGYGVLFPFQGMTINYGGRAGKYSQEIPKSRALKIEIGEMK